jgi:hypothetical protein
VIVPVPVALPVVGVELVVAGFGVVVVAELVSVPPAVVPVPGVVVLVPEAGTVKFWESFDVDPVVAGVVVPVVVAGTVTFASVGVSWLFATGGAAEVSADVAEVADVLVPVVVSEDVDV